MLKSYPLPPFGGLESHS